jgi:hypothetical protein
MEAYMKSFGQRWILSMLFSVILFSPAMFSQGSEDKVAGSINIGGGNKWDYLAVETSLHRLYVTHASEVNVIDIDKRALIGTIPNLNGVHGVAIVMNLIKVSYQTEKTIRLRFLILKH